MKNLIRNYNVRSPLISILKTYNSTIVSDTREAKLFLSVTQSILFSTIQFNSSVSYKEDKNSKETTLSSNSPLTSFKNIDVFPSKIKDPFVNLKHVVLTQKVKERDRDEEFMVWNNCVRFILFIIKSNFSEKNYIHLDFNTCNSVV